MTITALLYPCLSVFALSGAAPVAVEAAADMPASQPVQLAALQEGDIADQTAAPVEMERAIVAEDGTMALETDPMPEAEFIAPADGPKPALADVSDDEVFARAVAWIEGVDTLRTRFTQVAPSGNVSTGTMKLARPGRLRFDYDSPNPTLIIASQGLVYVHDTELETTDSYPVSKTPLKFLLSEKVNTADAVLTGVHREADSVALTLESTDPETQGQLVLEFSAPEMTLQRWAVYDPRGGVTVVELEAPETGIRIANNEFRVPEAGGSFLRDR